MSGFFGSGKSSFAKILGYTVGRRDVGGRPAGDLFLEVQIRPHKRFIVRGADLVAELPVAPWETASAP